MPDKTSPEPAVASSSLPVRLTYDASFVATMDRGPLSSSVASSDDANSSAALIRFDDRGVRLLAEQARELAVVRA